MNLVRRFLPELLILALALVIGSSAACFGAGSNAEVHARTALDVLREVVEPAHRLAMEACAASDAAAIAQTKSGALTYEEGVGVRAAIADRCEGLATTFDVIRAGHDRAATLIEQGEIAAAEEALERVRTTWRRLQEDPP